MTLSKLSVVFIALTFSGAVALASISNGNAIAAGPNPILEGGLQQAEISGQKFQALPIEDGSLLSIKNNGEVVAIQTQFKLFHAYELTNLDFETFPKTQAEQSHFWLLIRIDNQPFDSSTKHAEPFQEEVCVLPFGKCYISKSPEIAVHPRLIRFDKPMKGYLQCYDFTERNINQSFQLKLTDGKLSYSFGYNSIMAPNIEKLIQMSIALIDMMKL